MYISPKPVVLRWNGPVVKLVSSGESVTFDFILDMGWVVGKF